MRRVKGYWVSAALLICGAAPPGGSAQLRYILVDLGPLGAAYSDGRALNGDGQCVGFTRAEPGASDRAFRTDSLQTINMLSHDLGTLGGSYAQAYGINGLGQAAGLAGTNGDFAYRAFRTRANQAINPATDNLGLLGGFSFFNLSAAYDVNDSGRAVGVSDVGGFQGWPARAFRTAPNAAINASTDNLGTLGGDYSEARAINNLGQVTGFAYLTGDAAHHAFRASPNGPINPATDDLGTLGGLNSVGRDINEAGIVVGEAQLADAQWRAFRTAPNAAINPATDALGTLGGASSRAIGINNDNIVVGFSDTSDGIRHAFVYTDSDGMVDLNAVVTGSSAVGWVLVEARKIDDFGRIIGTGTLEGVSRAFVLQPTPSCDLDGDGDADSADVALLTGCLDGPGVGVSAGCLDADLDRDADADLADYAQYQLCP